MVWKIYQINLCVDSVRLLAIKINIGHKGSKRRRIKKRLGARLVEIINTKFVFKANSSYLRKIKK
jgi:hypothetical protein